MKEALSILIVDDDEDDIILLKDWLKRIEGMAFKIDSARSYRDGLKKIKSGVYDVVFLDYFLGAENALDLLLEPEVRNTPSSFIIITGHPSLPNFNEVLRAGASGWLSKTGLDTVTDRAAIDFALAYKHRSS